MNSKNSKGTLFKFLKYVLSVLIFAHLPLAMYGFQSSAFGNLENQTNEVNVIQQNRDIAGTITDEKGEPIIGASILIKGTSTGTISDANGKFTLSVPNNAILEISYVGYETQNIKVERKSTLDIVLKENNQMLDELIVVGYGTMKRRDVTGAVSQIKGDEVSSVAVPNPVMALQGKIAGVVVSQNSGDPSGSFTIHIRGVNSIRGGNDPLYVIDGMPASTTSIGTGDIESIEVLKDASATAIYGSRGANGVVLITTKGGKDGKTNISYDGSYGIQSLIKKLDVLDAQGWAKLINLQQINDEGKAYFSDSEIAAFANKSYDWQDIIFRSAPIQNHNVTVSGGNQKTKFLVSGSLIDRDGIVKPGNYKRYNLRSNISHDISNKLSLQLIMGYGRREWTGSGSSGGNRGGSVFGAAISSPPSVGPYNEDGSYSNIKLSYPFMSNAVINAVNYIDTHKSKARTNLENFNGSITYKPIKGLAIKPSFSMENTDIRNDSYTNSKVLEGSNGANVSSSTSTTIINENIINYSTDIKNHHIDLMCGFTYQQNVYRYMSMSASDFISDAPETDQIGSAASFGTPSTSYSKWSMMSYLARANYSYKGRYMATVSFRADGSSRYSEGNKWGYFPSFSLAWRISDEPFMKRFTNLSDLKLRIGYGATGSTAIDPYATMNMLSQGKVAVGESGVETYYAASTTLPSSLKWETTEQLNIGVDLAMFNSRLRVTLDLYHKLTKDLLNSVSLPTSTGYDTTIRNIGKMQNNGLELSVAGDIIRNNNLIWNLSGNIAFNKNKVKELYGGQDIYGSSVNLSYINDYINLIREGKPLGVFYTYKEDGYQDNGKIKYVDVNNDGVINTSDKMITGDPNPDFTYGLNTNLNYKGIELEVFFQGSQGNDIFNVAKTANLDLGMGLNVWSEVLKSHWDANNTAEQNAKALYPIISKQTNLQYSNRYVEDGSYLRLKNISLGYNFPINKWNINWIHALKVYVSGQNLLTFTNYSGRDPEVNSWSSNVNAGLDYMTYPNFKSITFGIKAEF